MASGDLLWTCEPLAGQAPNTDPAGLVWRSGDDTREVAHLVFDPGATDWEMDWDCIMPPHYDGGNIDVEISWVAESPGVDTDGNVLWGCHFKSLTPGADDADTKAYDTVKEATAAAPDSTNGVPKVTTITLTPAEADNVAAGEDFEFRLVRRSSQGGDTLNSYDAHVRRVRILEA